MHSWPQNSMSFRGPSCRADFSFFFRNPRWYTTERWAPCGIIRMATYNIRCKMIYDNNILMLRKPEDVTRPYFESRAGGGASFSAYIIVLTAFHSKIIWFAVRKIVTRFLFFAKWSFFFAAQRCNSIISRVQIIFIRIRMRMLLSSQALQISNYVDMQFFVQPNLSRQTQKSNGMIIHKSNTSACVVCIPCRVVLLYRYVLLWLPAGNNFGKRDRRRFGARSAITDWSRNDWNDFTRLIWKRNNRCPLDLTSHKSFKFSNCTYAETSRRTDILLYRWLCIINYLFVITSLFRAVLGFQSYSVEV